MAQTTNNEQIREKLPFNVYAMMLVLSFLCTLGACLFLNDELTTNWRWQFWDKPTAKVAENITKQNDNPDENPDIINLTQVDRDDYKLITGTDVYTVVPGAEWPKGFDPLKKESTPYRHGEVQWDNIRNAAEILITKEEPPAPKATAPETPAVTPPATTPATETPTTPPAPPPETK